MEVCNFGAWGTVCDIEWETADAQVACTHLGYPANGARALTGSDVPDGTGPIFLIYIDCNGGERSLNDCDADTPLIQNCTHSDDVGVACGE